MAVIPRRGHLFLTLFAACLVKSQDVTSTECSQQLSRDQCMTAPDCLTVFDCSCAWCRTTQTCQTWNPCSNKTSCSGSEGDFEPNYLRTCADLQGEVKSFGGFFIFLIVTFFALGAELPVLLLGYIVGGVYVMAAIALSVTTTVLVVQERLADEPGTGYAMLNWLAYIGGAVIAVLILLTIGLYCWRCCSERYNRSYAVTATAYHPLGQQ